MKRLLASCLTLMIVLVLIPAVSPGQEQCINELEDGDYKSSSRRLYWVDYDPLLDPETEGQWIDAIGAAIAEINKCAGVDPENPARGADAPRLVGGTSSNHKLNIEVVSGTGPGVCGVFDGVWGGTATITLYAGNPNCPYPQNAGTHELLHYYGLDESSTGTGCEPTDLVSWPQTSPNTEIDPTECDAVDRKFFTNAEQRAGEEPGEERPSSPLVLDLDGDGISTTNVLSDPVFFDLDGDGASEQAGWIAAHTSDAFLWLDLDRDGSADSGRELFGNHTLIEGESTAAHGFEALAQYDRPRQGGNGDGKITAEDAVWLRLALWNDWNHDAQTAESEVSLVSDTEIAGISLRSNNRRWTDEAGNLHYRVGVFWRSGRRGVRARGTVEDLWFQVLR